MLAGTHYYKRLEIRISMNSIHRIVELLPFITLVGVIILILFFMGHGQCTVWMSGVLSECPGTLFECPGLCLGQ